MKKIFAALLCALMILPIGGCSNKAAQTPTASIAPIPSAQTPSASMAPSQSAQAPAGNTDIILDVNEISEASVGGTLVSDISVGAEVQLVGVGKMPLSTKITAIEVNGVAQDKALAAQPAMLTFDASAADLAGMQRVVMAKHKKESELVQAKTFDDVLGTLDGTVYRNKTFGFAISSNSIDFLPSLNAQEGFRVSFDSPGAFYDFDIFHINSPGYDAGITLYASTIQAITKETAAQQLAYEYSQYELTPDNMLLADKEVAHVLLKDGAKITDCYAMIVNGYYLRWNVTDETGAYKDQLAEIMNSLTFDWVSESVPVSGE